MASINCLISNILKNIFFCVQHRKETHTCLEQRESELLYPLIGGARHCLHHLPFFKSAIIVGLSFKLKIITYTFSVLFMY